MKKILLLPILVLTMVAIMACQKTSVETVKTENDPPQTAATPPGADHSEHANEAPRITLADAKKDFDDGKAVFVDTRSEDSYKVEHVKGAINIPAAQSATRYKEIPTDKKIIAYCS